MKKHKKGKKKTVAVHVRMKRELWDKLDAARHANDRTLSEELNWRLQVTFLFNNGVEIIELPKKDDKKR